MFHLVLLNAVTCWGAQILTKALGQVMVKRESVKRQQVLSVLEELVVDPATEEATPDLILCSLRFRWLLTQAWNCSGM